MPDLFEIMESCRSMRRLKPDPVPDELIARILRAGIYAPNGGNTQKWRFLVIKDPKIKQAVQVWYKKAFDEVREPLAFKYEAYASWGEASGFVPADRIRGDFDKFAANRFVIGSQNEVVDQIGRYGEKTGTDHILLRVQWPGLGQKTVMQTLERLGRVVEKLH